MNGSDPNTGQRYFCQTKDKIEGPFDLIELAGLLRESAIDGDTPIRDEGTEEWRLLRERPEYSSLQEISIEVIARHVLAKERAQASTPSSTKTSFPIIWVTVGVVILLIGLVMAWPTTAPSTMAAPTDWIVTRGDHFSIRCPLKLEPVNKGASRMDRYEMHDEGKAFGVEAIYVPGISEEYRKEVLRGMEDDIIRAFGAETFSKTPGVYQSVWPVITSNHEISGDGYTGRERSYELGSSSTAEKSRIRIIQGRESILMLYVIVKGHEFDDLDMERYFKSLQLY